MTADQLAAFTSRCFRCEARVPIADLARGGGTSVCRDPVACTFRARLRSERQIWHGLRSLTVWQPWAFAISLGKSVENRTRNIQLRGLIAIHAGLEVDESARYPTGDERCALVSEHFLTLGSRFALWNARQPKARAGYPLLACGAVIAVAELHGAHQAGPAGAGCDHAGWACSPWAVMTPGTWHWQLRGVVPLETPVAVRGYQWPRALPGHITEAIRGQLAPAGV